MKLSGKCNNFALLFGYLLRGFYQTSKTTPTIRPKNARIRLREVIKESQSFREYFHKCKLLVLLLASLLRVSLPLCVKVL